MQQRFWCLTVNIRSVFSGFTSSVHSYSDTVCICHCFWFVTLEIRVNSIRSSVSVSIHSGKTNWPPATIVIFIFLLLLKEVYVKSLNDLLFLSIQRFFLEPSADDMKHFELVSNKSSSKKKRHEETSASHDSHPSFNKDIELCTVLESEERTTGRQMSSVSLALYRKTFLLSNPYN